MQLKKHGLLMNVLTSYDNQTFDTGRVLAFLYFLSTIIFQAWTVFHGGPFSPQDYLAGGGAFLAGLGIYLFGDKDKPDEKTTERVTASTFTTLTEKPNVVDPTPPA